MVEWDLFFFIALSVVEIVASILVIASKKLVHSAFWLAITLITMGGIYILLRSEFIAVVQILVYAGAVPVLFLFGIMLTRREIMEEPNEQE
ncbi:MAG: NADH:ubiquinone oxidoreductase subunit 6 (chain J) [Methanomassiliicoccales archaeon]|nr:MAG: NADH:ubiquinone oxidoreductase subunit 6 (chain J) [Methanomassiliicoccales archaeon]